MRLTSAECVLVLVDVQEKLYPHMVDPEGLVARLAVLLGGAAVLGIPVIVTQQYTRGLGQTIAPIRELLGPEAAPVVEKIAFGCCDEPAFLARLEQVKRRQVIIAGIEAHVCVLQTVIGLRERGYDPVIPADAVSSRRALDRDVALERGRREGAVLTTVESLLFELLRAAGTDTFRAVSRLVK